MDQQKKDLLDKLKGANNVLVTVSSNPSVDQLAACIGLTLLLNKLKKHATAVFSGEVPSTIEFLKPEETLEKNTDSLRDFIISLDKSKADKLRYKVEDRIVKIFITPYRTSITEDDLEFSQGDFNVDVILCLGVQQQQDLDQAITAHGRILHDAAVASISTATGGELGTINWVDPGASSLSELATSLADSLGKDLIDAQIATALLTGIVAETARFSNEKTSPETMRLSAELMSAGANQQLVASELQQLHPAPAEGQEEAASASPEPEKKRDGTLEIDHPQDNEPPEPEEPQEPQSPDGPPPNDQPPAGPESGGDGAPETPPENPPEQPASRIMLQPPSMGGTLTANSAPEGLDPSVDPLGVPLSTDTPMLSHDNSSAQPEGSLKPASDALNPVPPPSEAQPLDLPAPTPPSDDSQFHIDTDGNIQLADQLAPADQTSDATPPNDGTLGSLEKSVNSPHLEESSPGTPDAESARSAVLDALNSTTSPSLEPKADVGASGYLDVHNLPDDAGSTPDANGAFAATPPETAPLVGSPADQPMSMPLPPPPSFGAPVPDGGTFAPSGPQDSGEPQAPPVPPPMTELPPFEPPKQ